MDYEFKNLLGAPYRGGTLLLHGTKLISPAGNRLTEVELTLHTTTTYPFQNLTNVRLSAGSGGGFCFGVQCAPGGFLSPRLIPLLLLLLCVC